jgi:hypothetical protein
MGSFWVDDHIEVENIALPDAVSPVAAKCVDRSGPSKNFATVRHASRDEMFLTGLH